MDEQDDQSFLNFEGCSTSRHACSEIFFCIRLALKDAVDMLVYERLLDLCSLRSCDLHVKSMHGFLETLCIDIGQTTQCWIWNYCLVDIKCSFKSNFSLGFPSLRKLPSWICNFLFMILVVNSVRIPRHRRARNLNDGDGMCWSVWQIGFWTTSRRESCLNFVVGV